MDPAWTFGSPWCKRFGIKDQRSSSTRRERESSANQGERPTLECRSRTAWSTRRPSSSTWRPLQVGSTSSNRSCGQKHQRRAEDQDPALRADTCGIYGTDRFQKQLKPSSSKACSQSQSSSEALASSGARS